AEPHDIVALQSELEFHGWFRELALEPRTMLEHQRLDLVRSRAWGDDDLDIPPIVDDDAQPLCTPRHAYRNLDEAAADVDATHAATVSVPSDNTIARNASISRADSSLFELFDHDRRIVAAEAERVRRVARFIRGVGNPSSG